ncbi:MAG: hypothetical protein HY699_12995 [Deltaproteobacteria bacterium]|nr:hypothetical protein [Deltaproteobacteria bacterium]
MLLQLAEAGAIAERTRELPERLRNEWSARIIDAERQLRDLGVNPQIWWTLVPYVRFLKSAAFISVSDAVAPSELGPRYKALRHPIEAPPRDELNSEVQTLLAQGIGGGGAAELDAARDTARILILQRRLLAQDWDPFAERETPAWEAASAAAVAAGIFRTPTPHICRSGQEYFRDLDRRRRHHDAWRGRRRAEVRLLSNKGVIAIGKKFMEAGRKAKQQQAKLRAARNLREQQLAEEVWERHPEWSKTRVAVTVAKQVERHPDRIRRRIHPPTKKLVRPP